MQILLQRHKEHKAAQRPTAKQHDLPEDLPLAITPARAPGAAKGQPKGHETRNKLSNNTQLHKIYTQKDRKCAWRPEKLGTLLQLREQSPQRYLLRN